MIGMNERKERRRERREGEKNGEKNGENERRMDKNGEESGEWRVLRGMSGVVWSGEERWRTGDV
jgi:hypothetical protein